MVGTGSLEKKKDIDATGIYGKHALSGPGLFHGRTAKISIVTNMHQGCLYALQMISVFNSTEVPAVMLLGDPQSINT